MTNETKRYIGTKMIDARPMNRGEYNAYRGWEPPEDEDQAVAGYLVEYVDGGKANDSRHVGYISWSPADVFERSYEEMGLMANPGTGIRPTYYVAHPDGSFSIADPQP